MNVTSEMLGAAHDILLKKEIVLSADILSNIYMAMKRRDAEVAELKQTCIYHVEIQQSLRQQLAQCEEGCRIKDEQIETLEQQLATMTLDRDEWKEAHDVVVANSKASDELHHRDMEGYAAALAAIKLKDAFLHMVTTEIRWSGDPMYEAACKALTIQPDDAALKAWLGEPVAWKHDDPKRHDAITDSVKELLQRANSEYMHRPIDKTEHYTIPLYSPKGLK